MWKLQPITDSTHMKFFHNMAIFFYNSLVTGAHERIEFTLFEYSLFQKNGPEKPNIQTYK